MPIQRLAGDTEFGEELADPGFGFAHGRHGQPQLGDRHLIGPAAVAAPGARRPWSPRFNLDGFLVHSEAGTSNPVSYLQAFRSGALEAVESRLLYYDNDNNPSSSKEPQNFISSIHCERTLIVALDQFLKVEKSLGMEPPVFVMLSFVGVRGYRILSEWTQYEVPYQFDRDVLLLPESMVEDFDEPADQLLQPAFDAVWQAAGYERCRHYKNRQWFDDKHRPAPISPHPGPAR